MYYNQARAAANWWITEMKKRCHHVYPTKVTGNSSNLVICDYSLNAEFSRFYTVLSEEIRTCLEKGGYLFLSCCYQPNRDLSMLADRANISKTYFPLRASMEIVNDTIQVSINGQDLHNLPLTAV